MAISLKHTFTNPKPDGADATIVRPSDWNAEHAITMATNKLLGRATAGVGAVEEIDLTAFGRSLIDDADAAAARTTLGVDASAQPRADVASATTTDIGAVASEYVRITGTTTITGLGTAAAGVVRDVLFGGALTLTHNATSLILPSGANITTAAGDTALFRSEGSGNWRCMRYAKAGGTPVRFTPPYESAAQTITSGGLLTLSHGLGGRPSLVQTILRCVTTDAGYGVGTDLFVNYQTTNTANYGLAVALGNDTDISIQYGSSTKVFYAHNFTTGGVVELTNANWQLIVRAWR